MSAQTSFSNAPAAGLPGMRAESGEYEADSRSYEVAAGVAAGRLIVEGTTVGVTGKLPTAAGDLAFPVGFSQHQIVSEPKSPLYAQYDEVTCQRKGRIWLVCSGVISSGETVLFIVHTGASAGLPTELDDATTTALPAGHFLKCIKGGADGALGLFAVMFP